MTHVTCRLTAKNRDQLRNPTLGNGVWATFVIKRFIHKRKVVPFLLSRGAFLRSTVWACGCSFIALLEKNRSHKAQKDGSCCDRATPRMRASCEWVVDRARCLLVLLTNWLCSEWIHSAAYIWRRSADGLPDTGVTTPTDQLDLIHHPNSRHLPPSFPSSPLFPKTTVAHIFPSSSLGSTPGFFLFVSYALHISRIWLGRVKRDISG